MVSQVEIFGDGALNRDMIHSNLPFSWAIAFLEGDEAIAAQLRLPLAGSCLPSI